MHQTERSAAPRLTLYRVVATIASLRIVTRKTKHVPTSQTRNLPVCVECDRAFVQQDVEVLRRTPELALLGKINRIYTRYTTLSGDGGTDRDFDNAVTIKDSGKVYICHFCLEETYDHSVSEKRPLDEALADANRVVDEDIEDNRPEEEA